MVLGAIISVVGICSGVITIVGFINSLLPPTPDRHDLTRVRIAVGLDNQRNLTNAGGDCPDIRVWDDSGDFLGVTKNPGKIATGDFMDVDVKLRRPHQPTYLLLTAHDDAVCIAYISHVWPDGQSYGWIGNWADAWACNREWYYSNIILDNRELNCAWIDRNGDRETTAIQIHMPEFTEQSKEGNDKEEKHEGIDEEAKAQKRKDRFCSQNPPLTFYYHWEPNNITYWVKQKAPRNISSDEPRQIAQSVNPPDLTPSNRDTNPRVYPDTRIVRSQSKHHSATKLCESKTAKGPDLVSLSEGKFCDMTTREVFPLCDRDLSALTCFNSTSMVMRSDTKRGLTKEYSMVLEWGSKSKTDE